MWVSKCRPGAREVKMWFRLILIPANFDLPRVVLWILAGAAMVVVELTFYMGNKRMPDT